MSKQPHQSVIYWLLSGCFLTYLMVLVGCITRLTHSGLSITDWSVMGSLPPLSETSWNDHFGKYKLSPEFSIINNQMTLDEFKNIFWWEWIHRMIGRTIGLVFISGFFFFLKKGVFDRKMLFKCLVLFSVGALQGLVGWWMVKSGLTKNPAVSHFRLATHLITAFTAFAFTFWFALDWIFPHSNFSCKDENSKLKKPLLLFFGLLIFQTVYGAFVAGLKAGKFYPTWPKMGNEWFPTDTILSGDSIWFNFLSNGAGVQFVHRTFAWVVVGMVLWLWIRANKLKLSNSMNKGITMLIYLTTLQIFLGIFTLIYQVPVILGVLHQTTAFILFGTALFLLYHATSKNLNTSKSPI